MIGRGELLQERVGDAIGNVQHVAPQALERPTDDDGARRPVRLGRSRTKDVKTGRDEHETRAVGEETRGLAAKVLWQVRPKRRDPALVVPEDDVLDRHEGQDTTHLGGLARKSARV